MPKTPIEIYLEKGERAIKNPTSDMDDLIKRIVSKAPKHVQKV